jgi:hypothetical protein
MIGGMVADRHINISNNVEGGDGMDAKESVVMAIYDNQRQIMETAIDMMQRFRDLPSIVADMAKIIINAYNTISLLKQLSTQPAQQEKHNCLVRT